MLFIGLAMLIDAADEPTNKVPSITDDCGEYIPGIL